MNRPEDEAAIRNLIAAYCHCYDDGRADDFADLFTDDATFTVKGHVREGRAQIHEHIGIRKPGVPPGQHVTYNCVIEIDESGDTARGWTDFAYLKKTDDGFAINTAGRYHDRLTRQPDRWRFQTRVIVFLGDPVPPDA